MTELTWFKSSHSTNEDAACVEVAKAPEVVHVRDSKDKTGPQLTFHPTAWKAFVDFAADADL
ncbi:DUF397 domain-containing protein [Streptomyces sp. NRRL S-495]|uniref:DUF397 domain-containing protein n=1 Tax=Streptomyces sp. NRRL S-495 TaxID=1609133 RepID=UPI000696BA3B|nr:DUF397 domain-containing protein [Streptomyces sp. NRRL S-495]